MVLEFQLELEFGSYGIREAEATRVPGEKPVRDGNQQTQPTYFEYELNPGNIGRRQVLPPLHHRSTAQAQLLVDNDNVGC